ncbi:MAG: hypothetical protein LIP16_10995 [Clostridium sp.]|nr:hypothetical protein [Clostridium sp.]
MSKAYIILGNGFSIDFLHHLAMLDSNIIEEIDVRNLFRFGDKIGTPWDKRPGFLSYKNCPALWTLGARSNNTIEESTALIEEIITCANMFFDFVNEPGQKEKRLELAGSSTERIYLKAYSELITYLRHLFSCYDAQVADDLLSRFISSESKWGWLKFLKLLSSGKYSKITFVTYNYDVWLERILKQLSLPYTVSGFEENSSVEIEVIKPHGSISFVPRNDGCNVYSINYQLDFEGVPIDKLELKYSELDRYSRGALIPPAGDSMRLGTTAPWAQYLRTKAKEEALKVTAQDDVILSGISY